MKERCAGLVVVLVSLVAFGVGNAVPFHGVIDAKGFTVTVDSAILALHTGSVTFPTPGWTAAGAGMDSFHFGEVDEWPLGVTLWGTIDLEPNTSEFPAPVADAWVRFTVGGMYAPEAMFYGLTGVEELRSVIEPRPCLNVNPSVVTSQMTVRVQPLGSGTPVVEVHDAAGNVVRSLNCTAGTNGLATATWNLEDGNGRLVPEGVYFCRYATSDAVAVRKVLVAH